MRIANTPAPLQFSSQRPSLPPSPALLKGDAFLPHFGALTVTVGQFGAPSDIIAGLYRRFLQSVTDGDEVSLQGFLISRSVCENDDLLRHALRLAEERGHAEFVGMLNSALAGNALIRAVDEGDESGLRAALEIPLSDLTLKKARQRAREGGKPGFADLLAEALAGNELAKAVDAGDGGALRDILKRPLSNRSLQAALRTARARGAFELADLLAEALDRNARHHE